jgi:hypothetical protein
MVDPSRQPLSLICLQSEGAQAIKIIKVITAVGRLKKNAAVV